MKVDGRPYRTIWLNEDGSSVDVIDQRWLPHEFKVATLRSVAEAATAIRDMWVRGAPLIGATAAYGLALAMREDPTPALDAAHGKLAATRPTAINLRWALMRPQASTPASARRGPLLTRSKANADEDVEINRAIGAHGLKILRRWRRTRIGANRSTFLPIATPDGWLQSITVPRRADLLAMEQGLSVHVYVNETRPPIRRLTHRLGARSSRAHTRSSSTRAGGHLMQHGLVEV